MHVGVTRLPFVSDSLSEPTRWAFPPALQPTQGEVGFDLKSALDSVVALRAEIPDDAFTALERAVLAVTDAMTRDIQVPDALFEPLREHFDARALVELVATVAAYNMVSRFLEALRIGH